VGGYEHGTSQPARVTRSCWVESCAVPLYAAQLLRVSSARHDAEKQHCQQGDGDGATGWEDAWDETSPGDALLLDRLRDAKRGVTAARLLTKHGLTTSAAELAAADATAAARMLRQLFVRMASSIGITDARCHLLIAWIQVLLTEHVLSSASVPGC